LSAKPLVVVLIGPGGVGKGTITRRLLDLNSRLWLSRSWTTRAPRESEVGDEYYFVSRAEFEAAIAANQFLEWAEFHGNLYGTPKPSLDEPRDLLLEIEVQGAQQVRAQDAEAVVILILPPSLAVLEERLRGRGDSEDHVSLRLVSSATELAIGHELADFVVTNDDIERVTGEILSILESLRVSRGNIS